jgi:adenylate cyclase
LGRLNGGSWGGGLEMSEGVGGVARPVEAAPHCVICGTALAGPLAYVFRAVGVSRSPRNPNLCNRCNTHTEEGRLVELTVVFADLSSFTELTHELGPERTHEVADAFLRMATYALVRQGAFIDKYVGDAVMAFYNVPIRYADHAARAVAAALEIQAELPAVAAGLGLELKASIGIASGWARVGRLGSGDGKDYTAIGDVVNVAARLEGQAGPGEIVVDGYAYGQLADRFPGVAAESLALKGFSEPIPAYRLGSEAGVSVDKRRALSIDGEPSRRRAIGLGATIFAILGAPCAAVALVGPLAVALGLGSLFGALATSTLSVLDTAPIRIPFLTLATLGALANLYTLWHARSVRAQARAEERDLPMTRLERRRTIVVGVSAAVTLLAVAFELYAHEFVTHHPWP